MKRIVLFTLVLLLPLAVLATEKYALIIAIGDYPTNPDYPVNKARSWSSISSLNDVPLILNAIKSQGFKDENISILTDKDATKQGILNAIENLKKKLKKGDIVYIHFSGHGQQIFDSPTDGVLDEVDELEEALVPFDAYPFYEKGVYEGENHIRDDLFGIIIAQLRNLLGSKGQLLITLDSCHSGSMTRGGKARGGMPKLVPPDWNAPENSGAETNKDSNKPKYEKVKVSDDAAPYIIISGATADELNYEFQGVGSLSYAFSKALENLNSDLTYRQLFSAIAANMNTIAPKQNPTIEGSVDYKFLKGEVLKPAPYFSVNKISGNNDILTINGGQINSIFENTTVFVMASGTLKPDKSKAIATGVVTKPKFGESIVQLNTALKDSNPKGYWVYIDQVSYGDISVKVFIDPSVKDKEIINGINSFLKDKNLGEVQTTKENADVVLTGANGKYELSPVNSDNDEFAQVLASRGTPDALEDISRQLFNYAQGNYLKNLSLKNDAYQFEFKLIPVEYNAATESTGKMLTENDFYNTKGVFEVKPGQDNAVLEVNNKSSRPLYITIVEINSKGEISPFFPNDGCPLNDNERKLGAGQTAVFKNCVYSFGPPYERLVLKGFASDKPLNFQPTVTTRGETNSNKNPLESFLQNTYTQTRGSGGKSVSGNLEGYNTEFVYDIVKDK